MNNNKVLVTGGTGLLGSHLIFKLLSRGENVKATFRKSSNRELVRRVISYYSVDADELYNRIEWAEADLSDQSSVHSALKDVDVVYHCAAIVSFESADNEKIISNNMTATANIVQACIETNIRKLCHVSSVAALGGSDGELDINEDKKWNTEKVHPAYWTSKYNSEQEVWKGVSKGLDAVIVLPSIILGPGDWDKSSAAIFGTIAKGLPFYTDGIKAYVDVNDVADAMITLTNSKITGEKFIVSAENIDNYKLFSMVAVNLGVRKPVIKIPRFISPLVLPAVKLLQVFSRRKMPVTRDLLGAAWTRVGYDNSRIKEKTGLKFTPVEESVRNIASIYIKEKRQS